MDDREFDKDVDPSGRAEGRRFEPIPAADLYRYTSRETRNEFMQPTYWSNGRAALVIAVLMVLGVVAYRIFI